VASVGREQLQRADVQRLQPRQWLNDEVINFYGAMILERAERWTAAGDAGNARKREEDVWFGADELGGMMPPKLKSRMNGINGTTYKGKERERGEPVRIHYFNTFFYAKLTSPGYEKARLNKWTKKVRW
jgi:sentrin-specific protease 1